MARGQRVWNRHRIGQGLNYIPAHARPVGSVKPAAMLVRGADRYGHFELVQPAQAELDPAAVAVHDRAVALYRDCYLEEEPGTPAYGPEARSPGPHFCRRQHADAAPTAMPRNPTDRSRSKWATSRHAAVNWRSQGPFGFITTATMRSFAVNDALPDA